MTALLLATCLALLLCTQCYGALPSPKAMSPVKVSPLAKADVDHSKLHAEEIKALPKFEDELNVKPQKHASHPKLGTRSLVISILADVCPHGMMPLAYGMAQGGPTGWVVSLALLVLFGSMSTYTMLSYASLAKTTNSTNIGQIWAKLINRKTAWVVDASIFALTFGCCVFYSAFIGDIFTALASATGLGGLFSKRWIVLLAISSFVLLPLTLLEDLSALSFSSMVGAFGIMYTLFFHTLRSTDGTYAVGSEMLKHVSPKMQPSWPQPKYSKFNVNSGTLVLINMLCVAFLAHYNSINLYDEFENPTPKRYNFAVGLGFGLSMVVFTCMMFLGYGLFGTAAQPLLLNNFPLSQDPLATVGRVAVGLAITVAYPLMFAGLKSSMYGIIYRFTKPIAEKNKPKWQFLASLLPQDPPKPISERLSKEVKSLSTVAVLVAITAIAVQCGEEDVSIVLGLVGSVLGCFAAYVLPGVLKLSLMRMRKKAGLKNTVTDVVVNHGLIAIGVVFGALGVMVTVQNMGSGGHH